MCQISYNFLHSIFCKVKSCMYANLIKLHSFMDIFKKSYNVEPLFSENLYLQNALHWMLLSFGCCFDIWQSRMHQENKVYCGSKRYYRGTSEKGIFKQVIWKITAFVFLSCCSFFSSFCSVLKSPYISQVEKLHQKY